MPQYTEDFRRNRFPDNQYTRKQDEQAAVDEEAKEAARARSANIFEKLRLYKAFRNKKTENGEDHGDSVQGG